MKTHISISFCQIGQIPDSVNWQWDDTVLKGINDSG